jgi:hypothetical protein
MQIVLARKLAEPLKQLQVTQPSYSLNFIATDVSLIDQLID